MCYDKNDRDGGSNLSFKNIRAISSPLFLYPKDWRFDFNHFYQYLKQNGFVIYPGKISDHECFSYRKYWRDLSEDILELTAIIKDYKGRTLMIKTVIFDWAGGQLWTLAVWLLSTLLEMLF